MAFKVVEVCAGGGGQALGLEAAGFDTAVAIEIDKDACSTLRLNRPNWNVLEADLREVDGKDYYGVDMIAGGVPCPPFSIAGKQLGEYDERDLFPTAIEMVQKADPKAVMLENVRGLSSPRFQTYRESIVRKLDSLGYAVHWNLVLSSNFGVPQLRPRFVLIAVKKEFAPFFKYPESNGQSLTVGDALYELMAEGGWKGAKKWREKANDIAPTIVGGSKKHGGADLGPTRAREKWLELGVDGRGIVVDPPSKSDPVNHVPRLTNAMVAVIQGFPKDWQFAGSRTSVYRQIGNAFPPPVAKELSLAIFHSLKKKKVTTRKFDQLTFMESEQQSLAISN